MNKPPVGIAVFVGLDKPCKAFVTPLLTGMKIVELSGKEALALVDEPMKETPSLLFVGTELKEPDPLEIAQLLRMLWPNEFLCYLSEQRREYEVQAFIKNGFQDTFALNLDSGTLKLAIGKVLSSKFGGSGYKSVKLLDIQSNTILDFDTYLYLPMNNKYVQFSRASEALTPDQVERLKSHKVSTLFVPLNQLAKFYEYTSGILKGLGDSTTLSATEKRDRLQSAVRDLLTGASGDANKQGSFDAGKELMSNCSKIVEGYISIPAMSLV